MGEFFDIVLGFPTALFSFSLLVVAGYWVLVVLGGLGVDVLDADADTGAGSGGEEGGFDGVLSAGGLGGVPVTVALSLLIGVGWFVSLVGSVLVKGLGGLSGLLSLAVLIVAAYVAWLCARLLVLPLRRIFRPQVGPSLQDFVGRTCVIRTGRVGPAFGQAEVTAPDGSSALVQVRQPSDFPVAGPADTDQLLTAGSTALIFDYDPAGEFFWVMPYDAAMDPDRL
jgi:hypothetical protein